MQEGEQDERCTVRWNQCHVVHRKVNNNNVEIGLVSNDAPLI